MERNNIRGGTVSRSLDPYLRKYKKFLPVIAAIYQLVDGAVAGELTTKVEVEQPYVLQMRAHRHIELEPDPNQPETIIETAEATLISLDNMRSAISTVDYYMEHAKRVYGCIVRPE